MTKYFFESYYFLVVTTAMSSKVPFLIYNDTKNLDISWLCSFILYKGLCHACIYVYEKNLSTNNPLVLQISKNFNPHAKNYM